MVRTPEEDETLTQDQSISGHITATRRLQSRDTKTRLIHPVIEKNIQCLKGRHRLRLRPRLSLSPLASRLLTSASTS